MTARRTSVRADLTLTVHQPAWLVLQIAVADVAPAGLDERLVITCDGAPLVATEVALETGGRAHSLAVPGGSVTVNYQATVEGRSAPSVVTEADRIRYLRPSRYAESDRLAGVAHAEFSGITGAANLLASVSSWVGSRLAYVPGSSGPTDGAVETLLSGQGVCRDYAHVVVGLLRALDVPARLVAVYAPGLSPMDFHAVAEAAVDDQWRVVDATVLAPRSSLVRISTGRDAADTAFLSTYGGLVDLDDYFVAASTDGQLPTDDVTVLTSIS